jgi:hypothetical protein
MEDGGACQGEEKADIAMTMQSHAITRNPRNRSNRALELMGVCRLDIGRINVVFNLPILC